MVSKGLLQGRGFAKLILWAFAAGLSLLMIAEQAQAIPVFARKYGTSCITCHTIYPKLNDVGEAFRRNGYQFPSEDEVLVKEEPLKLGTDAYKEMFPNSIWPSTLPSIPPVSIFTLSQNIVNLQPHGQLKTWDLAFPTDIELIGEGAFGKDISGFYDIGFTPADGASVGRVFVQFSNLCAWDSEEDDDGCHKANRWCVLPPHFLNLRVGKIDPAILPHVITQESFAQFPSLPTNTFSLGQTGFTLFAEQPAIELDGIYKQYLSYAVGIANGGSAVGLPVDDNTFKDVYFSVDHRWFGYPLDGVLGQVVPSGNAPTTSQSSDAADDSDAGAPGLDFWRAWDFDTAVYGWFGKSNVPLTPATASTTTRTTTAPSPMITSSGSVSMRASRGSTSTFTEPPSGGTTRSPALTRTTLPLVPPTTSATWSKRITWSSRGSARSYATSR